MAVWAGWAKVETLLATAAATLSQPITMVQRGLPQAVPTRMVRFWYEGIAESPFANADTLNRTQDGLKLTVGVFIPMGGSGSADFESSIDELIEEADRAIQSALMGDFTLNANATAETIGVRIEETQCKVVKTGEALVRYLEIPVTYGVADVATIAG